MKTQLKTDNTPVTSLKQIIGIIFSLLAGLLGYAEAPELVLTFGAFIGTVYVLTNLAKTHINVKGITQILSWLIGLAIASGAWVLNIGIFENISFGFALVTGFFGSLVANGIFDSDWLEDLWGIFKIIWQK